MSNSPEPDSTPAGPAYEGRLLVRPDDDVVDQGAGFDLATLMSRRSVLGLLGAGAGALALAACGGTSSTSSSTPSAGTSVGAPSTSAADGEIPQETNGPYPADGTSDLNVLGESGIVRRDITSSLDGGTTVDGVPLTFTFDVTDILEDDAPFEGAAVYVWHCDAEGRYSMYSSGVEDETFLRGIQVVDASGEATFDTIVPGCYSGRWPHIHFEVYPDLDSATDVGNAIATSQVAFPQDVCDAVYALDGYPGSASNLAQIGGIDNDGVFGDGYDLEMGSFTGDAGSGFTGSLAVAIDTSTEASAGGMAGGMGGGPAPGGPPPGAVPPSP